MLINSGHHFFVMIWKIKLMIGSLFFLKSNEFLKYTALDRYANHTHRSHRHWLMHDGNHLHETRLNRTRSRPISKTCHSLHFPQANMSLQSTAISSFFPFFLLVHVDICSFHFVAFYNFLHCHLIGNDETSSNMDVGPHAKSCCFLLSLSHQNDL